MTPGIQCFLVFEKKFLEKQVTKKSFKVHIVLKRDAVGIEEKHFEKAQKNFKKS